MEIVVCGRCCYLWGRRSISCWEVVWTRWHESPAVREVVPAGRARVHIDTRDTWTRKHATRFVWRRKRTDAGVRRCGWCSVRAATDGSGAAAGASPSALGRCGGPVECAGGFPTFGFFLFLADQLGSRRRQSLSCRRQNSFRWCIIMQLVLWLIGRFHNVAVHLLLWRLEDDRNATEQRRQRWRAWSSTTRWLPFWRDDHSEETAIIDVWNVFAKNMEERHPARLMICVIAVAIMTTLMDGRVRRMPQSGRPLVQRIMSLRVKVCDNRIRKLNVFRFGWWPRLCVNFHSGPTWRPESQILCQSSGRPPRRRSCHSPVVRVI